MVLYLPLTFLQQAISQSVFSPGSLGKEAGLLVCWAKYIVAQPRQFEATDGARVLRDVERETTGGRAHRLLRLLRQTIQVAGWRSRVDSRMNGDL